MDGPPGSIAAPSMPADPDLTGAVGSLGVGIIVAGSDGNVTFLNSVAEQLTGWVSDEAIGRRLDVVFRLSDAHDVEADADGEWCGRREEAMLQVRDGGRFPIEYSLTQVHDTSGRSQGLVIVFRSISERRLLTLHLTRAASHDRLTGLLNREAFLSHLEEAIEESRRGGKQRFLLFLDVDQFKLVNNTCDHAVGDQLLLWVAELLRELVDERDVVARLGGDEFALLVGRPALAEGVCFAERVQRRLGEFLFTWEDMSFTVSAGIGVTPVGPEFASAAQLLSAVDHACYMAKDKGRSGIQVYEHGDAEVARRRAEMSWVSRINHRMGSGKVRLYAQPIRPLSTTALPGLQFEVLLRMVEEDGSLRAAGDLVQAAERYGLMPTIDRWVVRTSLRALRDLANDGIDRVHLCSINLSGLSLRDDTVLDTIRNELAATGIPPHKVCFEITETAAVKSLAQAKWLIQELGSIGCNLALDDFGTGVASYSYLKELPVNYLKVAGSFVESMVTSPLDRAMVESINQISHLLGVETVAENVDSRELFDQVRAIGVDHAQGFWVGMPRPLEEACRVGV